MGHLLPRLARPGAARGDQAAGLAQRTGHLGTLPYLLLCACKAHLLAGQAVAAAGWRTGLAGRKAVFVLAQITLAAGDPRRCSRQLVAASGGNALPAWPLTCRPKVFQLLTDTALVNGDIGQARRWVTGAEQAATQPALGRARRARPLRRAVPPRTRGGHAPGHRA